ncbi:MAG: hypothetical protein AAGG02_19000, partial [Cyanobacteria bacterium P01_H01_bin.15]
FLDPGSDTFVLGTKDEILYDDYDVQDPGLNDFAWIDDYDLGDDVIELFGDASQYELKEESISLNSGNFGATQFGAAETYRSELGVSIYYLGATYGSRLQEVPELIGFIAENNNFSATNDFANFIENGLSDSDNFVFV